MTDAAKLQNEYAKLVEGLQEGSEDPEDNDGFMTTPGKTLPFVKETEIKNRCSQVLPDDLLHEAIPGNIRKAEHFVAFLKRFVEYLKVDSANLGMSANVTQLNVD